MMPPTKVPPPLPAFPGAWKIQAVVGPLSAVMCYCISSSKDRCRCRHSAALWHCQAPVAGSQNDRPGSQYLILQLHCFHLVLFLDTFFWQIFFHKVLPQQGKWSLRKVLTSYHPVCLWHFASCDRIWPNDIFSIPAGHLARSGQKSAVAAAGKASLNYRCLCCTVKSLWERL